MYWRSRHLCRFDRFRRHRQRYCDYRQHNYRQRSSPPHQDKVSCYRKYRYQHHLFR
ncbi:hypothetical protein AB1N83_009496 [Pleurotus pulmonarius]